MFSLLKLPTEIIVCILLACANILRFQSQCNILTVKWAAIQ